MEKITTILIIFIPIILCGISVLWYINTDIEKFKKRRLYKKRYELMKRKLHIPSFSSYKYDNIALDIEDNLLKEDYDKVDELLEELKSKIN